MFIVDIVGLVVMVEAAAFDQVSADDVGVADVGNAVLVLL